MGLYINTKMDKEDWLIDNSVAMRIQAPKNWESVYRDKNLPVVLVDNGPFTAAAVCFSEEEMKAFLPSKTDQRPRIWFIVPIENILGVCPDVMDWIK